MTPTPTVVFFPEAAFGPTNNCVAIGERLLARGARVVFVIEESFAGTLAAKGFEERLMRLTAPPAEPEVPGQFWKDFIRETAPVFRSSTIEQLEGFIAPTWQALIDGAMYVDGRLEEILDEVRPDVVVEDNVVAFPAIVRGAAPWVRIVSCNPLEIPDPALPPVFSGYPVGDRSSWEAFREEYARTTGAMHGAFDAFVQDHGCPPLPGNDFIHASPDLNLYLYPEAADYERQVALDATWRRIGSCVRAPEQGAGIPAPVATGEGSLVYLSLGSLGSADTDLMQRLIDVLGTTAHRYLVSMGPQHEQLRLAGNMAGAEFLPQAALLPQCDLVITHGGNNTITESFHAGKPMIVAPIFWDQHDNAQRIDETGFGVRLDTYGFADDDLVSAVDRLLADRGLHARLTAVAAALAADPGAERAAGLIAALARGS